MHCVEQITSDMFWIGASSRRLSLFENIYPIPRGVSYNSYLLLDEKTVLFDTVDVSVKDRFFENLEYVLDGRKLDYLIVNHMEPDHCASMEDVIRLYPDVKIIANEKTVAMIKQFFNFDIDSRLHLVKETDTFSSGKHTFAFVPAPMVHWPEAMVTYDLTDKILYSADAFGTFGALNGNIFADEVNFKTEWLDDARRYYTNIVGKYGTQVQALLEKASSIEIEMICPLHGPVWREGIDWFIEKYKQWSSYTPETNSVLIVYGSIYGHTENAAEIIASKLAAKGVRNIAMYDVSTTHPSYILAKAFQYSHIVFASSTYNAGIFSPMETLLHDIAEHNLQNRTVALVENGTWAPESGNLMKNILSGLTDIRILEKTVTINSSLKKNQLSQLDDLVEALTATMKLPVKKADEETVNPNAFFNLSYGLYALITKTGNRDNACIINTVTQLTDTPKRIMIAVNKANYSKDVIEETGKFNISVLTEGTPFKLFERFGFVSGRDKNKFEGFEHTKRSENGLCYLDEYSNAYLSCTVTDAYDYGTHILFIADVDEAKVLSNAKSVTYSYYFENIKPKPQPAKKGKKGFVCKICGFVYEGDTLPEDYICPLCKHGAEDFEPLE